MTNLNPKYPIYIISKSRWKSRLTSKSLEKMNVPYTIVVEEQEYEEYTSVIDKSKILILPPKYKEEYDTFDTLGDAKGKGPGAARNFCWDNAIEQGAERHWVMDDNIYGFVRWNNNLQLYVKNGCFFRAMEDFVDRYENVAMAGPNYYMFVSRKTKGKPFVLNTRIYSCNLIRNDLPYRWRGRYNEDTDLSLRMLKDGWCTIEFNAFLQKKMPTQTVKGGNTAEFYTKEGTYSKSEMQVRMHPDISRLVWKFGRWHHAVDYRPFKNNRLIKKKDIEIKKGVDNHGMKLRTAK